MTLKNIRPFTAVITLSAAMILLAGCVTRTSVKNEPRVDVRFADTQAAQTFYDAYLAKNHPSNQSNNTVCVTLPLPYHHAKVKSENARFNSAVKSADSDTDGTISDAEASAYATRPRESGKKK